MPFYPHSRLLRRGNAGSAGPLVIVELVAILGLLIAERRCGTVGTSKLVGHACECVDT
jgi:hypothetical protein